MEEAYFTSQYNVRILLVASIHNFGRFSDYLATRCKTKTLTLNIFGTLHTGLRRAPSPNGLSFGRRLNYS